MTQSGSLQLFITCPAGLESLLKTELEALGEVAELKETVTGVFCTATLEFAYRACLWSRFANRVLLVLAKAGSGDVETVYQTAKQVAWETHIAGADTLKVDFAGTSRDIRHTQYGAQLIKDAIVDRMQGLGLARPDVDLKAPMHRINVRLTARAVYISLDLAGESLHKRGYRSQQGLAPIKENLAAALLTRAKWPQFAEQGRAMVDPMCGSATFLIEAAMMATDMAPGHHRQHYGFLAWQQHDAGLWAELREQAVVRAKAGLQNLQCQIVGFEIDANIAQQARKNIENAGFAESIRVRDGGLSAIAAQQPGLLLCNPPYGMRLGEPDELSQDYATLAELAKQHYPGWTLGILSSEPSLLSETRLRFDKKYKIFNGPIACELRLFSLRTEAAASAVQARPEEKKALSENAKMVANRLRKNLRKLKSWRERAQISCYRVYDADLPEYAAAIDVYADKLHIQEYRAPDSIDTQLAERRFKDLVLAARDVFDLGRDKVFIKTRKRNRGQEQYEKHEVLKSEDFFEVSEQRARLWVNLKSYLDSGLFLDHRPLRLKIGAEARAKKFLNLFCYTASASVHAALGGAQSSVSVDMSNTYLQWAQRNFELNNIHSAQHKIVRADVMSWLKGCREGFDIIMLDPPSFSNSKKMDAVFDVQRDHENLVSRCMDLLKPNGVLYFSNNFRKFKLAQGIEAGYAVRDMHDESIDLDFQRNQRIHSCYEIRHRSRN